MADKGPDDHRAPHESTPLDTWLRRLDCSRAAETAARERLQRACNRMTVRYLDGWFQRLERENEKHGRRSAAAATAGLVACVVVPLLIGATAVALSVAGVTHPFGLSEATQNVIAGLLTALPIVYLGIYRTMCSYLHARHRELREEAAHCLSCAIALVSGVASGSSPDRIDSHDIGTR